MKDTDEARVEVRDVDEHDGLRGFLIARLDAGRRRFESGRIGSQSSSLT